MPYRIVLRFEPKPGDAKAPPPIGLQFIEATNPKEGMLVAAYAEKSVTVFPTKEAAEEAITRTVAYGRARGHGAWVREAYEIEEIE